MWGCHDEVSNGLAAVGRRSTEHNRRLILRVTTTRFSGRELQITQSRVLRISLPIQMNLETIFECAKTVLRL